MDLSRGGNPVQTLFQCLLSTLQIAAAKLDQHHGQVVLIIVRIPRDRIPENVEASLTIPEMRIDIAEQRKESIILLPHGRDFL